MERPITRDMLVEMFDNMASQGWDLSKPMVWGYFFVDDDRSRLEAARRRLEAKGYEFVEYLQPEEPGDPLMLHVRKVEVHTVETLEARNERFYELAEELGLVAYDGMDVGPIELDPEMKEQDDARH